MEEHTRNASISDVETGESRDGDRTKVCNEALSIPDSYSKSN